MVTFDEHPRPTFRSACDCADSGELDPPAHDQLTIQTDECRATTIGDPEPNGELAPGDPMPREGQQECGRETGRER